MKVRILTNLGIIMQWNFEEAEKYLSQALELVEKLGNLRQKVLILNHFGEAVANKPTFPEYGINSYSHAEEAYMYFEQAFKIAEQIGDP
ncbi:MAG: hypothetical protein ACFFD2_05540, partial [Promethearchaeota archaeon]